MDRVKILYRIRHLADCKFKFSEEKFLEANKTILAFCSPVFDSMFFGHLAESKSEIPIIEIIDADYEVFDKFLLYLYTKIIEFQDINEAEEIYYLARKYEILDLEYDCLNFIGDRLCPDIVCMAYETANYFDDQKFKKICMNFISDRTCEVLLSRGFLECDIDTVTEIMKLKVLSVISETQLLYALEMYAEKNNAVDQVRENAVKHIQFLRMSHDDFMNGPMKSNLLTNDEKLKIIGCILTKNKDPDSYKLPSGFSELTDRLYIDRSDVGIVKKLFDLRKYPTNPQYFTCIHYEQASISHIIMKCSAYDERRFYLVDVLVHNGFLMQGRDFLYTMLTKIENHKNDKCRTALCDFIRYHDIDLKYLYKLDLNEIEFLKKLDYTQKVTENEDLGE
uniref:CSON014180 protein n=1 Tax=Culicoides sonorensis TaxID=179676 RepID=A0A336MAR1_CULSO